MSRKEEPLQPEGEPAAELPRRLCNEIQLFDLCELERCRFKNDRFCTDPEMISRFEALAEPEDRPVQNFDDDDEELYSDDDDYDTFDDEDQPEEDDEW
jgi:hypothetical protein